MRKDAACSAASRSSFLSHVGVGLEEEPDVRVPDTFADHLRTHTGFQRAGRVRVAQIHSPVAERSRWLTPCARRSRYCLTSRSSVQGAEDFVEAFGRGGVGV